MLSHRDARPEDVPEICGWPQSADELFFLSPKATFPLTPDQLSRGIAQRFDSTVVLLDGEPAGFANFYVRERGGTCAIGNVAGLLLYPKLGFAPYGIEPRVDHRGDRVALVHMRLGAEGMERHRGGA